MRWSNGSNVSKGGEILGKTTRRKLHKGLPNESCPADAWKLVFDESIEPKAQNPGSLMFELVSPILSAIAGQNTLSNTVAVMSDVACIRVNESMGLHIHVEARE